MGGASTRPQVLAHLNTLPSGTVINRKEIGHATGLDEIQVRAAMYSLIKAGTPGIATIMQGKVWRWEGGNQPAPDPNAFTGTVIERAGGHVIVRDGEGYLYLVKRIGLAED